MLVSEAKRYAHTVMGRGQGAMFTGSRIKKLYSLGPDAFTKLTNEVARHLAGLQISFQKDKTPLAAFTEPNFCAAINSYRNRFSESIELPANQFFNRSAIRPISATRSYIADIGKAIEKAF